MSYLAAVVHFMNKYPDSIVKREEASIDVFSLKNGELLVAIRKNGWGMWECAGKRLGAAHPWCMAPIPKEARAFKLYSKRGEAPYIGKSEEHAERAPKARDLANAHGYVPSLAELSELAQRAREMQSQQKPQAQIAAPSADLDMRRISERAFVPVVQNEPKPL